MTVSNSTMTPHTTTKSHKIYNLILPISLERRKVLLGYKRRGFGVGKFNGFGGKVEPGETIVASAKRELEEESGIICSEDQLHHHAVLLLETVAPGAEQEKILEIHVFVCTEWTGEIIETEEMSPQWFSPEDLPLKQMWEETRIWMKTMLEIYLSNTDTINNKPPSNTAAVADSTTESKELSCRNKRFAHYVDYRGGINEQTGEWDPWHGMDTNVLEWTEKTINAWCTEDMMEWVGKIRNAKA